MNKIVIGTREHADVDQNTLALTYENANKWLTMLRSDYFKEIVLADIQQIEVKNLRFLIQFSRLLKNDGSVVLRNGENKELNALLLRLNLHEGDSNQEGKVFLKTKPQPKAEEKIVKLSIGFKSNEAQEEIDQSELMKGENLEITKKKAEKCETKPRACANCSCGRKDAEKNVSKEDLIKGINEGQPVSGCGKCFMGDSFRCGSCPYKGLPAFKPGDKLKLMEEGGVMVEEAATVLSATGKVKLQL